MAPAGVHRVSAGGRLSLAVCEDGTIQAWGDRTGFSAALRWAWVSQAAAGDAGILASTFDNAALTDGSLDVGWPSEMFDVMVMAVAAGDGFGAVLTGLGDVVLVGSVGGAGPGKLDIGGAARSISISGTRGLALLENGTAVAFGEGEPLGAPPAVPLRHAAAGFNHAVGLTRDGKVVAWGPNASVPLDVASEKVVSVSAGDGFSTAVTEDGRLLVFGSNAVVVNIAPADLRNNRPGPVAHCDGGYSHVVCLLRNGTVVAFGDNAFGQSSVPNNGQLFGNFTTFPDPNPPKPTGDEAMKPPSATRTTELILATGSVVSPTTAPPEPTPLPPPTPVDPNVPIYRFGVRRVVAGPRWSFAVMDDGTVRSWGRYAGNATSWIRIKDLASSDRGATYALTTDNTIRADSPQGGLLGEFAYPAMLEVEDDNVFVQQIAAGGSFAIAVTFDGRLFAWGDYTDDPKAVLPVSGVRSVSAGLNHALVLLRNGTVRAFGFRSRVSIDVPPGLNATAVAAGTSHSLAVLADGRVEAWGSNTFGEREVPAELRNGTARARSVHAGTGYSLALLDDGRLLGWGAQGMGPRLPPAELQEEGNVRYVSAGQVHALALLQNGTVVAFGSDEYGAVRVPSSLGGQPDPAPSSGLSGGAIAGIVIGCVAGLALLAGLAMFLARRRRRAGADPSKSIASSPASTLHPEMESAPVLRSKSSGSGAGSSSSAADCDTSTLSLAPESPLSPAPPSVNPGDLLVALMPFAPQNVDEVIVNRGDYLLVHEVFADGWASGENGTTKAKGLFPLAVAMKAEDTWTVEGAERLSP
ncbi:regulator of chromosome condensation 1/beta-lactamase-inhibitor protein II [Hyaloraphidium curvatum]|nr:regulator of chromosome condensation 1/beta-lactamase-inhibitor protein II [Hyaloraphidium curvatum]